MVDTKRTRVATTALFTDNVAGDISWQDARDMLKSVLFLLDDVGQEMKVTDPTMISPDYGFDGLDGETTQPPIGSAKGFRMETIIDSSFTGTLGAVGAAFDFRLKSTAPSSQSWDGLRSSMLIEKALSEPYTLYSHTTFNIDVTTVGFGGAGVLSDNYSTIGSHDAIDGNWRAFMADNYGTKHLGTAFYAHASGAGTWRKGLWVEDSLDIGAQLHYSLLNASNQWIGLHTINPETAGEQWAAMFSRRPAVNNDYLGLLWAEYASGATGYAVGGNIGVPNLAYANHGGAIILKRTTQYERAFEFNVMTDDPASGVAGVVLNGKTNKVFTISGDGGGGGVVNINSAYMGSGYDIAMNVGNAALLFQPTGTKRDILFYGGHHNVLKIATNAGAMGAGLTDVYIYEGATPTIRRLQWKLNSALAAGDMVAILV